MIINVSVGGTPGKDCNGYCKFCYFRGLDHKNLSSYVLGCKYCPPDHIGCNNCQEVQNNIFDGFRPLPQVLSNLITVLNWYNFAGALNYDDKILTCSSADITNYPQLNELLKVLNDWGFQIHLGYISGKGIKNEKMVTDLIDLGVSEVNFSVFSTNPELRRYWMRDKTPEKSLKALKLLCESIDVNASTVVIPGVIDEEEIINTCSVMEEWGVKSFILDRFTNYKQEGLIFNNRPVIDDIETQSYEEFIQIVKDISSQFKFRIIGSPYTDPEKTRDIPYMLSKKEYRLNLTRLPEVTQDATIITSKLSLKPLETIFRVIAPDKVNVIGVNKEIGDLITREDLETVDLGDVQDVVVIPGGALVHDMVAREIFNEDGKDRDVVRGPMTLFYPDTLGTDLKYDLEYEINNFRALIEKINDPAP